MTGLRSAGDDVDQEGGGGLGVRRGGRVADHAESSAIELGGLDRLAGGLERPAPPGPRRRRQGELHGPDTDAHTPVAGGGEVDGDRGELVGGVEYGLHLVARRPIERTDCVRGRIARQDLGNAVAVGSAAALIDGDDEHAPPRQAEYFDLSQIKSKGLILWESRFNH
ncbi:hypothetical protein ACFOJ6_23720 [Gordonia humi]|uniref:hypothetical protein n=1 Tax=Gordonia humi TaxID=686429 RepID=UPI0036060E7E